MKTINPEWKKAGSATRGTKAEFETIVVPKPEHGRFDDSMGELTEAPCRPIKSSQSSS